MKFVTELEVRARDQPFKNSCNVIIQQYKKKIYAIRGELNKVKVFQTLALGIPFL